MPLSSAESPRPPREPSSGDLDFSESPRGSASIWVSRQVRLMSEAWANGRQLTAAEVIKQHPGLSVEHAVRLVYEEVCLRREAGQDVPTAEVTSQYPQWKEQLEILLDCDRLLWPLSRTAVLPEVGEELGPFHLLGELGRGASGKTFLAEEPALADRLVVLKISALDHEEHLSLARLQHTNIIPLYSEQTFPERGLRLLCMPYFGGTSLVRILAAVVELPPEKRRGRHVLEIIDQAHAERIVPGPSTEGPYRRFLEQASYVQAVCWVVACLADALHEAHTHGLVHMDVKPSNVLIAGDGLPMLLDFHLARKPVKAGERVVDRLGGTPSWMAPEQEAALKAVSRGDAVPGPVDHRADLYALGLLLCEALSGPGARSQAAAGKSWRQRNPLVSIGLADIVQKCLAPNPADRYHDAAAVADDLRRYLNDLPLRGVPNRSWAERWRKWRRRQPGALARGTAWSLTLAAMAVVLFLAYSFRRQGVREIETALDNARQLTNEHRFPEAFRVLNRGLERASTLVPASQQLKVSLEHQLLQARLGQTTLRLHDLADIVRFRYGMMPAAGEEARTLVRTIQTVWEESEQLLKQPEGSLDAETDRNIRNDLLELAVVRTDLTARLAAGSETERAHREALAFLDKAALITGPSSALDRERRIHARALGHAISGPEHDLPPRSAWEHYSLGRCYLRDGAIDKAAQEFERALDIDPQKFWPNFYEGLSAYELGRFEDAVAAFRTCIALAPTTAYCYYNRARALEALGRSSQAFKDYARALELDPSLTVAALNRGALSYKAGRLDAAIADFQLALRTSTDPANSGRIHYNLALAFLGKGDRASARASLDKAVACGFKDVAALRDKLKREP
ncbi:MAG: tetratricopeptide repeat protein [Isosphaeraceae bacterium]